MTVQEHNLVLGLFASQMQSIEILLRMLKSRGLVEHDDIDAFSFAVTQDDASNVALLQRAKEKYMALAKAFGVDAGLEHL